jgi:hypothetical protein
MSNGIHERARNRRSGLVLAGLAVLATMGCDDGPTNPQAPESEAAIQSVQEVWELLPATVELESEALDRLTVSGSSGLGAALLLDAGELATEADAAALTDQTTDAALLEDAADSMATDGFFSVFGPGHLHAMISDVASAQARLDAALGSSRDTEIRTRLAEAADGLRDAHQARDRGQHARALRRALWASDRLRWLDPEAKATAAVAAATALLERAVALAGDDVEPPIARALTAARAFCTSARVALETERWRLAVADARACARISRAVIVRLSAGIDPALLAERAEEAIAHAGAVLERVSEEAGPTPEPRVAELLQEAGDFLGRAIVAFDEERYRVAIGLAWSSTAHSLRALRYLRGDVADPFELRATAAVEVAIALSARVAEKIGPDTPAELTEAGERADALLGEASAAFSAEHWYEAWTLARQAIVIYVRLLVALA